MLSLHSRASIEKEIKRCVDDIWKKYDEDKNCKLDRKEVRRIVIDSLKVIGEDTKIVTDRDFDELFKTMDKKCTGAIDKDEMFSFIKMVSQLFFTYFLGY